MMKTIPLCISGILVISGAVTASAQSGTKRSGSAPKTAPVKTAAAAKRAIAVMSPTQGNTVSGTVTFTSVPGGILIEADIKGLTPGKHGFHIHAFGDCSGADGKTAGGHFNPHGHRHGGPDAKKRHSGDLGNIVADESGHGTYMRIDQTIKLSGPHSIIGHGLIIHAGEDDLTSQPTGAAGARVACGVIGVAASGP